MDASSGSTRLRVSASRAIFSERAAVPPTAAEVSTISASSIRGVSNLLLEGGVTRGSGGQLSEAIGPLRGRRKLRLRELQGFDGLLQGNGGRVISNRLEGVGELCDGACHVLAGGLQASMFFVVGVCGTPIRGSHLLR